MCVHIPDESTGAPILILFRFLYYFVSWQRRALALDIKFSSKLFNCTSCWNRWPCHGISGKERRHTCTKFDVCWYRNKSLHYCRNIRTVLVKPDIKLSSKSESLARIKCQCGWHLVCFPEKLVGRLYSHSYASELLDRLVV